MNSRFQQRAQTTLRSRNMKPELDTYTLAQMAKERRDGFAAVFADS
jgi:hypothetical protein